MKQIIKCFPKETMEEAGDAEAAKAHKEAIVAHTHAAGMHLIAHAASV